MMKRGGRGEGGREGGREGGGRAYLPTKLARVRVAAVVVKRRIALLLLLMLLLLLLLLVLLLVLLGGGCMISASSPFLACCAVCLGIVVDRQEEDQSKICADTTHMAHTHYAHGSAPFSPEAERRRRRRKSRSVNIQAAECKGRPKKGRRRPQNTHEDNKEGGEHMRGKRKEGPGNPS